MIFSFGLLNVKAEVDLGLNGKSSVLVDNITGKVLYSFNENEKLAPASMTKLASMLLVMENIDAGKLKLDDKVTISSEAADMGGSQVFLQEGEVYTVNDLLKSVAIASGNDAVVALAEKIGGSVNGFVDMLNKRMTEIGAKNTHFVNPHGLDAQDHYSTALDMSIIARELLKHPKILEFTSIYEDYLVKNDGSRTWLVNTNKLVRFYNGVDGLKTGFTQTAGYCLTATAKKDNFRLISVVMGEETAEKRSSDTVKLLNYGFNTYKINVIKTKKEILGKVRIESGKKEFANVVLLNDAIELLKNSDEVGNYKFDVKVKAVKAPIQAGDVVGTALILDEDNNVIDEVDITVDENIQKANLFDYLIKNMQVMSIGKKVLKQ